MSHDWNLFTFQPTSDVWSQTVIGGKECQKHQRQFWQKQAAHGTRRETAGLESIQGQSMIKTRENKGWRVAIHSSIILHHPAKEVCWTDNKRWMFWSSENYFSFWTYSKYQCYSTYCSPACPSLNHSVSDSKGDLFCFRWWWQDAAKQEPNLKLFPADIGWESKGPWTNLSMTAHASVHAVKQLTTNQTARLYTHTPPQTRGI